MLANIIASSEQLSVLERVLDQHCAAHGISKECERSEIARHLIDLFGQGIEDETELREHLGDYARPAAA